MKGGELRTPLRLQDVTFGCPRTVSERDPRAGRRHDRVDPARGARAASRELRRVPRARRRPPRDFARRRVRSTPSSRRTAHGNDCRTPAHRGRLRSRRGRRAVISACDARRRGAVLAVGSSVLCCPFAPAPPPPTASRRPVSRRPAPRQSRNPFKTTSTAPAQTEKHSQNLVEASEATEQRSTQTSAALGKNLRS